MGSFVKYEGKPVFCIICGSFEMEILEDPELTQDSKDEYVIACCRCPAVYAPQQILDHLYKFTDKNHYYAVLHRRELVRTAWQIKHKDDKHPGENNES